jgi:hypothetical protein
MARKKEVLEAEREGLRGHGRIDAAPQSAVQVRAKSVESLANGANAGLGFSGFIEIGENGAGLQERLLQAEIEVR